MKNKLGLAGVVLASVLSFGSPARTDDLINATNPNSPLNPNNPAGYYSPLNPVNPNSIYQRDTRKDHQKDQKERLLSPKTEGILTLGFLGLVLTFGIGYGVYKAYKEE